jgi:hypothetical protein
MTLRPGEGRDFIGCALETQFSTNSLAATFKSPVPYGASNAGGREFRRSDRARSNWGPSCASPASDRRAPCLLSVREAASILNVSTATVYGAVRTARGLK